MRHYIARRPVIVDGHMRHIHLRVKLRTLHDGMLSGIWFQPFRAKLGRQQNRPIRLMKAQTTEKLLLAGPVPFRIAQKGAVAVLVSGLADSRDNMGVIRVGNVGGKD